ncbi:MAG: DNA polymerase III subunit chi [Alphaproteobacteria bacterium]|jgi:DNA polymerase IIIc chi subunit|nr:DNA polymerase III subunit chi [Candidatus Jidaibacter sp.]
MNCKDFISYKLAGTDRLKSMCKLIDTIYKKGNNITVICPDETSMAQFDDMLWKYEQLSFVPHLCSNEENASITPVVLSTETCNINRSSVAILYDVSPDLESLEFEKLIYMYEAKHEEQTSKFNLIVEKLKSSNINVSQYAQSGTGSWEKI